ncbi:MAG TPA: PP2C family serine/threonine-protein phosphatase [Pyrinomonadaceae bacterium]|nr:PP2C family serine/threonine-protein phosphatase [Pyrinomonadaceae bacterium]
MNQAQTSLTVRSSALSDRGLNERRPINEDAFLEDSTRRIFAVADGVGGAEAGEVASQTAIEVLDEAFRHHVDRGDIEDLMELAIQRANASIHQMAQEHERFSMMATTIVALHLRGNLATIGHVGDSRLYRLTPEGRLILETEDHSIVEEEVRAGRMTREQAANHPSKNVISRALGAEDNVEVDMKTIEVESGTEFLLCTDGITRHLSDGEIRQLLINEEDTSLICEELKRRCYDRGAEDNLTAVVVRYGPRISVDQRGDELERTISPDFAARADTLENPYEATEDGLVPPSRIAFPANSDQADLSYQERPIAIPPPAENGGVGRLLLRLFLFFVVIAAIAGAFIAGARYRDQLPFFGQASTNIPEVSEAPVEQASVDPIMKFEKARREVDNDAHLWLKDSLNAELASQGITSPLDSVDPEFLYLYGRASLLTGNAEEAGKAFEAAITTTDLKSGLRNSIVRKEATLGLAAVSLKTGLDSSRAVTHLDEMIQKPALNNSP